jgi:hypothetical protein
VITGDARANRLTEDIVRVAKSAKVDQAIIDDLKDIFGARPDAPSRSEAKPPPEAKKSAPEPGPVVPRAKYVKFRRAYW